MTQCEGTYYEDNGLVKQPSLEEGLSHISMTIEDGTVHSVWSKSRNSQVEQVTYTIYDAINQKTLTHTETF